MKRQRSETLDTDSHSILPKHNTIHRFSTSGLTWLGFALALFLVLAATWKLTVGNRVIARGDLLLYFYPLRDYASAALRTGTLPLWNPYTFMGAPFLANSQAGFFYPLNLLTAWFPVGHAVSWSIALHLCIAAVGMFVLARTQLRLGTLASLACAISFGLGGYLGAQVEHLNQLQVLAWLPFELALLGSVKPTKRSVISHIALLSLLIALQLLAGHTQSLYICMVALGIAGFTFTIIAVAGIISRTRTRALAKPKARFSITTMMAIFTVIAVSIGLAALVSAIQLLPTAELATQSARSGGLPINEVGSFSWRPWVIARALLPTYGDPLFPEYVTYLGVTGIALALLGAVSIVPRLRSMIGNSSECGSISEDAVWFLIAVILPISGVVLALGIATPLFNLLYRLMPGFNLFRAQTRWLILFAVGAPMLIGYGVQALRDGLTSPQKRAWLAAWLLLCIAMVAGLLAGARFSPEAEYKTLPASSVIIGWCASAVGVTVVIATLQRMKASQFARIAGIPFVVLLASELLIASQFQPYSRASDEQALTDLRPSTASLIADKALTDPTSPAASRVLALSGLFFDPGDLVEQRMIYHDQLNADELYDRVIASKQKEILSPNLSLYYRIQGVDGYDGGLLPLARYASFTQQFIAGSGDGNPKPRTSDGRLREALKTIPDNTWLEQMSVRFIITDKTRDVFVDNVYYDLQFPQAITTTWNLPLAPFDSTALGLVLTSQNASPGDTLLDVAIYDHDTLIATDAIRATVAVTQPYFGVRVAWQKQQSPTRVVLTPTATGTTLLGMTSIHEASGAFKTQQIHASFTMQLVHSGDVKIYENLRPAPRVTIAALAECSTVGTELTTSGLVDGAAGAGTVKIMEDAPERMVLDIQAEAPGYVIVRDAWYPGWSAKVDNDYALISPIDKLFRAIPVLPGKHHIVMTYEPQSVYYGAILTAAGIACWLILAGIAIGYRMNSASFIPVRFRG